MAGKPLNRKAKCHPLRAHYARGLCVRCYGKLHKRQRRDDLRDRREYYKQWRDKNRELIRYKERERYSDPLRKQASAKWRRTHQLKRYGLSEATFRLKLAAQGNRCAICQTVFTVGRHPGVDHEHMTGQTRGLLCNSCNCGLGNFGDDPTLLKAAEHYLREWRSVGAQLGLPLTNVAGIHPILKSQEKDTTIQRLANK